jgi:hypothetical protein
VAKRRPSILQELQLDGKVIEASAADAPTPVKPSLPLANQRDCKKSGRR